jgi:hypothetical protein
MKGRITMSKIMFGLVLTMGMLLVGCGAQPGKNIVKYEKGATLPNLTKAPRDGVYALYSTWDTTAITSFPLMKDDKLGFDSGTDGGVVAVAGNNTYMLKVDWAKGSYYWKLQKE